MLGEVWSLGTRVVTLGGVRVEEQVLCDGSGHFRHRKPQSSGGRESCDRTEDCPGGQHERESELNCNDLPWIVQTTMEIHITVPKGSVVVSQRGTERKPFYRFFLPGNKIAPAMLFNLGTTILNSRNREVVVRTGLDSQGRPRRRIQKVLLTLRDDEDRVNMTVLEEE